MTNVKFGVTTKPINSTSRIFYGGSTVTLACRLKEPCSRQNPVFEVQGLTKLMNYNFAEWENYYYWIDDIIFITNDIQEVHCHLDPLATFYDEIINNDYYVIYGNQKHWNDYIDDIRMQPEVHKKPELEGVGFNLFGGSRGWSHPEGALEIESPTDHENIGGCVVVTVYESSCKNDLQYVGAHGYTDNPWDSKITSATIKYHQGVNSYVMSYENFLKCVGEVNNYFKAMVDMAFTSGGQNTQYDGAVAAGKLWGSVSGAGCYIDNFIACTYLPLKYSDVSHYAPTTCNFFCAGSVPFGVELSDFECRRFNKPIVITQFDGAVTIPWGDESKAPSASPTIDGKYAFLRNRRWTKFQLYTPSGFQELDPIELKEQTQVHAWTTLNLMTGEWSLRFTETGSENSESLASANGCIGYSIMHWLGNGQTFLGQLNNVQNKVGTAILSAYLKTDMTQATSVINSVYSDSAMSAEDKSQTLNYYQSRLKRDQLTSGIEGNFNLSGVSSEVPQGNTGGNLASLFLSRNIGRCFFIGLPYVPKDIASYNLFCTKHGFPVNKWLNLKNDDADGYIQCAGAYLDYCPGATMENLSTINSYLNHGIVIEE